MTKDAFPPLHCGFKGVFAYLIGLISCLTALENSLIRLGRLAYNQRKREQHSERRRIWIRQPIQ